MGELVELQAGEWALWRTVAVRAAGFPADGLAVFGDGEDAGLAGLAGNERFREALTWQNQDALRNALDRLSAAASGSTHRCRVETVASYWQRYCAKNDTIGFFGPLGWGRLADDGQAVVEPGDELLAARVTRFEVWVIDALAAVLAEDPAVRRWIPPRRHPARVPADLRILIDDVTVAVEGDSEIVNVDITWAGGHQTSGKAAVDQPQPEQTVQPASSAVRSGRSTTEPSSGAIASQPSATGRPVAYCAAASAATPTASSGPATRPPGTLPGTGPAASSQVLSRARASRRETARQDRRGTGRTALRRDFRGADTAGAAEACRARLRALRNSPVAVAAAPGSALPWATAIRPSGRGIRRVSQRDSYSGKAHLQSPGFLPFCGGGYRSRTGAG